MKLFLKIVLALLIIYLVAVAVSIKSMCNSYLIMFYPTIFLSIFIYIINNYCLFSRYCFRQQKQVEMTFLSLVKLMIFILPACILLLLQPDFGSTVVLLAIVASLFFVAGFKFRYFFVLLLSLASVFWLLVYKVQYRWVRITSFLDPWADPLGDSYQLVNSLIAIGSGGWFGVGLGESMQKLGYLPEAHTDFIFAVIAEELGLIGVVLIIGIYALLIWRIFSISLYAMKHNRVFQGYFAFSVGKTFLKNKCLINYINNQTPLFPLWLFN